MSKVSFLKVKPEKKSVYSAVSQAMEMVEWQKQIVGNKIFVKINAMNHLLLPGTNTSPWVLEGVLAEITKNRPGCEIFVGDANLCSYKNVDEASVVWGFKDIAASFGAKFINLSKDKMVEVNINGKYLKKLLLPEIILKCQNIITVPVIKTHVWSTFSASLKNQFGCIPSFRHEFHLFLEDAIADINTYLKPKLTVVDGTIGLEGTGPRTGEPKICNVIMASADLVASDVATAHFMGFDPNQIPYIQKTYERGLGSLEYEIVGDKFETYEFKPHSETIVTFSHKLLRKSPLEPLFFRTKIFNLLAHLAVFYNVQYWYRFKGKRLKDKVIKESGYGAQFKLSRK